MTMNLYDAKRQAARLGVEIRYPRRTGEVLFLDRLTGLHALLSNRRKDTTRNLDQLLRRAEAVRLPQPPPAASPTGRVEAATEGTERTAGSVPIGGPVTPPAGPFPGVGNAGPEAWHLGG